MRLIIFDGDDTLWQGLDGGNISDNGDGDWHGSNDYTYAATNDHDTIARNDGQRLRLFPETRAVLAELGGREVLVALCTFNHPDPVRRALDAWQLSGHFHHIEAAWSSDKEAMLRNILATTGVSAAEAVFIDDDPGRGHREQAARAGVRFLKKGTDVTDLRQVLGLLD